MNKKSIYNLIILDESGSMEIIKPYIIKGFNEVVQNIKIAEKKFPEQEHYISFVTFNGWGIKTKLDKNHANELTIIDEQLYLPDGGTPLWDAIGISVLKLKMDIATKNDNHVFVTILTDGEENASKDFNGDEIKRIVDAQKELGWEFTYIGANHNVSNVASSIGIDKYMEFKTNQDDMKVMFSMHVQERNTQYQRIHQHNKHSKKEPNSDQD